MSSEIVKTIDSRRALYVAALLHDIAKGREEDHSIAGARIARELGPRFGLNASETETAAWLVEHHLSMSLFAQSRDLNDPKTIRDFAALVQSRERLKLLLILTVADIRAVGPGVWTGWKGQLLRTLYFETEPLLGGGHTSLTRTERMAQAQNALRARLSDWPKHDLERFIERHAPSYWLRTDLDVIVEHAKLIREAEAQGKSLATRISTDAFRGVTEITLLAPNHPRLLALVAGACAGAGANIMDAQITTTRDGVALDTIHLEREFDHAEDEERRAKRIADTIERLLRGDARLADVVSAKRKPKPRLSAFTVEPQVVIDNTLSDALTVIEINGLDRSGLLYDVTQEISRPQSRYRVGAYRDLRREGGRRFLRHRPDRQEDHERKPRGLHSRAADQGARGARARAARSGLSSLPAQPNRSSSPGLTGRPSTPGRVRGLLGCPTARAMTPVDGAGRIQ